MKWLMEFLKAGAAGPTPHGVGGLKCSGQGVGKTGLEVPPHTGWVD